MSLQYGELRPTNGWDRLAGLGHTIIFQRVSRLSPIAKNSPSGHHRTTLLDYIVATKACIDNRKKLFNNISPTCPQNTVNFGLLASDICWRVWGTPTNFNGFRVLAGLLHGTLVVASAKHCGVEQRAPPMFGRWPSGWALAHILVVYVLFCVWLYVACMCSIVTWWGGPGGIEAWSFGPLLPLVLWHCWLGHLTRKTRPRYDL